MLDSRTIESLFGPASEIIDITDFLSSAGHVLTEAAGEEETVIASTIAEECRWLLSNDKRVHS
jgi:hypothetical protein